MIMTTIPPPLIPPTPTHAVRSRAFLACVSPLRRQPIDHGGGACAALDMLGTGKIDVKSMITHRFGLDQVTAHSTAPPQGAQ